MGVFNQILFRVFSYLILHSETDHNTIAVPRVREYGVQLVGPSQLSTSLPVDKW
jgi:hypothetical protein